MLTCGGFHRISSAETISFSYPGSDEETASWSILCCKKENRSTLQYLHPQPFLLLARALYVECCFLFYSTTSCILLLLQRWSHLIVLKLSTWLGRASGETRVQKSICFWILKRWNCFKISSVIFANSVHIF